LQPRGTAPTISKSKQKIIFDSLFGNDIIKYASKIIATSRIESDQYQNVFTNFNFNKVVHIPNPIDIETYIQLPKKGEFKKKYHIDANEKIILFLSRIHERKGADILIEAFSDLKKDTGFVKLIIAGPDEGYLHKLKTIARNLNVQDDVIFPGPLYEMNKLEAFVDADVFVLPAKDQYESFGNVVLEALMCSTPVVITSNCGISEWIESDMGHVIEYDTNQLKVALADILKNTYSKEAFIDIKERLIAKFEWVNIIEKIESVYNLSKKDAITYI
jgi:glycosyltransferase involved in cell wall biosynthesis